MDSKFFKIGGAVIVVRSDLPIRETTFHPKFNDFKAQATARPDLVIHHHFLPNVADEKYQERDLVYRHPPWAIFHRGESWIYEWITADPPYKAYYRTVVTNEDHTRLDIYNDGDMEKRFTLGNLTSLAMFPSDQILLGRWLAYNQGCILHSLGVILDAEGYLFVGHSDAGKSTMAEILRPSVRILCDDRNIARKINGRFNAFGTWSHGDVPDVSSDSAPLGGIFFLNQSLENTLVPVHDKKAAFTKLLACLIRPLTTRQWWNLSLDLLEDLTRSVPCWNLQFTKTGNIAQLIRNSHD